MFGFFVVSKFLLLDFGGDLNITNPPATFDVLSFSVLTNSTESTHKYCYLNEVVKSSASFSKAFTSQEKMSSSQRNGSFVRCIDPFRSSGHSNSDIIPRTTSTKAVELCVLLVNSEFLYLFDSIIRVLF